MTLKQLLLVLLRLVLGLTTIFAIFVIGTSLFESWQQPQIQSRLELYQTNILLDASLWQPKDHQGVDLIPARNAIVGEKPLADATEQYQEVLETAQTNLKKAQSQLAQRQSQPITTPAPPKTQTRYAPIPETSRFKQQQQLQQSITQLQKFTAELNLRIGILQAQQGETPKAIQTWQSLEQDATAAVLIGLWSNPPRLLPDAESLLQKNLDGWFRYQALARLYQLQQRQTALENLQAAEQQVANQAVEKLVIIGTIPALGGLIGVGLIIFLLSQWLVKRKQSLLAQNANTQWPTPWSGETILYVFIFGFFLVGQILVPIVISSFQANVSATNVRTQAFYILLSYLLLALGTLGVMYLSLKPYFPLPEGWFRLNLRGNWLGWGIGGYCVALPLVVAVSLINQQIWQGEGGSNPLLSLALQAHDQVALAIFFVTAAIAAPLFEEFLFRGFLLPSLTRYFPVWGAIVISSLLFAIAHLSLSEILPLTVLAIVLGVVYTRSRNLLASMLIHSLWNGGTLLSLFILGSSST